MGITPVQRGSLQRQLLLARFSDVPLALGSGARGVCVVISVTAFPTYYSASIVYIRSSAISIECLRTPTPTPYLLPTQYRVLRTSKLLLFGARVVAMLFRLRGRAEISIVLLVIHTNKTTE